MTARRLPAKHLPKALLGLVMERRLTERHSPETVSVSSAWDVWWACYRAALSVDQLGVQVTRPGIGCADCDRDAVALATESPPRHPDAVGCRPCNCLLAWAIRMRGPAAPAQWPSTRLTLALLKPGAPHTRIRAELERTHEVLTVIDTVLTTDDTRRLYPEAYGADYVGARDAYLTGSPVQSFVLHARWERSAPAKQIKATIRQILGADELRNHLHMPDNPGEAFADIAHFAGPDTLTDLYGRYEHDRSAERMAFYRTALGISRPDAHRSSA
ncbi:hypothetical protein [Actinoallomurus sp. CA-150999]|uniref:hypothetical protein n=1 Tax=Actinoallomurus sp. CA-150999 TaxID=3239887 RepID=UPI003D8DA67F